MTTIKIKGSDKQIKWASDIQQKNRPVLRGLIAEVNASVGDNDPSPVAETLLACIDQHLHDDDAHYIIKIGVCDRDAWYQMLEREVKRALESGKIAKYGSDEAIAASYETRK